MTRCRWSCVISAPIGITRIGSWSNGSCPWSRNSKSWVAPSKKPQSCCLRSYVTATRRSGKQSSQHSRLMLCRSATWHKMTEDGYHNAVAGGTFDPGGLPWGVPDLIIPLWCRNCQYYTKTKCTVNGQHKAAMKTQTKKTFTTTVSDTEKCRNFCPFS